MLPWEARPARFPSALFSAPPSISRLAVAKQAINQGQEPFRKVNCNPVNSHGAALMMDGGDWRVQSTSACAANLRMHKGNVREPPPSAEDPRGPHLTPQAPHLTHCSKPTCCSQAPLPGMSPTNTRLKLRSFVDHNPSSFPYWPLLHSTDRPLRVSALLLSSLHPPSLPTPLK